MTPDQLPDAARLRATGLSFARATSRDGANLASYEPVDWAAVIPRVMGSTGWTMIDEQAEPVGGPQLRLVRPDGHRPGRPL